MIAFSPNNIDTMVKRYVNEGWSLAQLAKWYHTSAPTIRTILVRRGVTIAKPFAARTIEYEPTPAEIAEHVAVFRKHYQECPDCQDREQRLGKTALEPTTDPSTLEGRAGRNQKHSHRGER